MITFSESKIKAKVAVNDAKIVILNGEIAALNNENERLMLLLDPNVANELTQFIEVSSDEPPNGGNGEDEDNNEGNEGTFTGMRPSEATYRYILPLQKDKPGTRFRARVILERIKEQGCRINGDPQFEWKNYTISLSQDKRLNYKKDNESVAIV